jgi:hypothetical protein
MVTANFNFEEYICPCCNRIRLIPLFWEHVEKMERLRQRLGFALIFNSAYRCPEHNRTVGGALDSWHMKIATDTRPEWAGIDDNEYLRRLQAIGDEAPGVGFRGIGTYSTFRHLDCRPVPARWNG